MAESSHIVEIVFDLDLSRAREQAERFREEESKPITAPLQVQGGGARPPVLTAGTQLPDPSQRFTAQQQATARQAGFTSALEQAQAQAAINQAAAEMQRRSLTAPVAAPPFQIPYTGQPAPSPAQPTAQTITAPPVPAFTRTAIESRLKSYASQFDTGFNQQDYQALIDTVGSVKEAFTFFRRLPTEVRTFMQGRPELRNVFRVSQTTAGASGADAMSALGDRYFDIAERYGGSQIGQALREAQRGYDPQAQLDAGLYQSFQRRPAGAQQIVRAERLQPGHTFTVYGQRVNVREDEDEQRVLESQMFGRPVPLEGLTHIPIDRGTLLRMEAKARGGFLEGIEEPEPRRTGIFGQTVTEAAGIGLQVVIPRPQIERVGSESANRPEYTLPIFPPREPPQPPGIAAAAPEPEREPRRYALNVLPGVEQPQQQLALPMVEAAAPQRDVRGEFAASISEALGEGDMARARRLHSQARAFGLALPEPGTQLRQQQTEARARTRAGIDLTSPEEATGVGPERFYRSARRYDLYREEAQRTAATGAAAEQFTPRDRNLEKAADELVASLQHHAKSNETNAKIQERSGARIEREQEQLRKGIEYAAGEETKRAETMRRAVDQQRRAAGLPPIPPQPPGTAVAAGGDEEGPQRVQVRRVAPAEEEEPGAPPPPPTRGGRIFGLRPGRLGQYFTAGFLALEGSRIARAYLDRRDEEILAGPDQNRRLGAELTFQRTLESTPIVGPLAGLLADFRGPSQVGTRAILQSAEARQAQTLAIFNRGEFRRTGRESALLADAAQNEDEARQIQISQQREAYIREGRQSRDALAEQNRAVRDARQAELDAATEEARRKLALAERFPNLSEFSDVNVRQGRALVSAAEQRSAVNQAGNAADRAQQAMQERRAREEDAAIADRIATAQQKQLDTERQSQRLAIRTVGAAAQFRAIDLPGNADLTQLVSENMRLIATAAPSLRADAYRASFSRIGEFFSAVRKTTEDVQSETRAINFATGGNRLAADLERIGQQEKRALEAVPVLGSVLGFNLDEALGTNRQRRAIQGEAQAQRGAVGLDDRLFSRELRDRAYETGLEAQGRPIAAQIAEIQDAALRQAARFQDNPQARRDVLQIGINEELAIQRRIETGGQATEITPGSFLPGSGEGGPQLEEMVSLLRDIRDATAVLRENQ